MKVKATNKYQELKLKDSELDKIPNKGEEFEVTEKRFDLLNGNNKYDEIFVIRVEEKKEAETVKKTTKRKTNAKKET